MTHHPCRLSLVACRHRGATLIEILISMLIIVIASIATLQYFGPTRGQISKSGNRRAALERARQRMEQLSQAGIASLPAKCAAQNCPPQWLQCVDPENDGSCAWAVSGGWPSEIVPVGTLPTFQPIETTVQWLDDVDAPPPPDQPDILVLDVKVGFNGFDPNAPATDTDFHRVHLRTLRAP